MSLQPKVLDTAQMVWNLQLQPLDMVLDARNTFGARFFREILIIGYWIIWTTRNKVIFDNDTISINKWKQNFVAELAPVCIKAK